MRRRFLIIHNPEAGNGRRGLMHRVMAALDEAGCDVTLNDAGCGQTGRDIAAAASMGRRYDAVVAAGGDGTIRSVAEGLRGTGLPVGILPLGTGNVMAHEIGLARTPAAIVECLREGEAVSVRGAIANGSSFFLMAGIGLDAEAVAGLDLRSKRRIGKLAYVWPVVRAIFAPVPRIEAQLDGAAHVARWVVLCKAGHYAGGFRLSPASDLSRPGLVAVLCTARTRAGLVVDILMIGAGQAARAPNLTFMPFHRASLIADRATAVQLDGETFGILPLEVVEDRLTVDILMPPGAKAAQRHRARAAA